MTSQPKRRWQFGLRSIFAAITGTAILIWLCWFVLNAPIVIHHGPPEIGSPEETTLKKEMFGP